MAMCWIPYIHVMKHRIWNVGVYVPTVCMCALADRLSTSAWLHMVSRVNVVPRSSNTRKVEM